MSAGSEVNPGTDGAEAVAAVVELVAGVLGDIGPKRRRVTERDGMTYVDLTVPEEPDE